MAPEYAFLTRWRVRATAKEVAEVLGDAPSLARWWPSVYLDVTELSPGDPTTHVGRVIDLYTKGWLPYTLRWKFTVTESRPPQGFSLVAEGDFEGTGVWTITEDGDYVDATYDWRIAANKPLLRYGTLVMRPIFAANHRWAMARGLESLELELRRRRARTAAERDAVPAPPGPTFRSH
ncbi:MAG: polyketide cyclase [Chloroflexi bacterium]|nr:MAG: polyketide cyclase [Actinobacteria bacterium 13_2_20CM_2_66_6]TMD35688.1 MAG: polyketide cyclase [Chloroflexota bacterium]TMD73493.1 MAG: polyketide cyclase [Chloroflexota bacterium]